MRQNVTQWDVRSQLQRHEKLLNGEYIPRTKATFGPRALRDHDDKLQEELEERRRARIAAGEAAKTKTKTGKTCGGRVQKKTTTNKPISMINRPRKKVAPKAKSMSKLAQVLHRKK
ncbi:hypothetical protein EJ04DRAFT_563293 [Polyplosphaeria fusca]|uniref:Uncharacterized protein n=1 Tax=Polyplosphaeria fusca TaxID=682080 RepID=A0A9P4R2H8_9PLEO|nr:hypothetical protein EJ04DRAFT_563293 [Polyplosphaeria fusca]